MKKTVFLMLSVIYSITTSAQQTQLSSSISINIPSDAQKLNKNEALAHARKKFNNDKIALLSVGQIRDDHVYKIRDILVSLNVSDAKLKVNNTYLSDLKKGFDALTKRGNATNYTSNLRKINNNNVLITNEIQGNVGYCYFYCLNANHTREITGALHYSKEDAIEAEAILDQLLNSIKFKD